MHDDRIWASYVRSLRRKNRSEQTIDGYRVTFELLLAHVQCSITEVRKSDLEDFFDTRLSVWKTSTVDRDYRNLSALFTFLYREEWITHNPIVNVHPPAVDTGEPRVLSDDELKTLIKSCRGNRFVDRRDEAIIRLLSEPGGPRRAEMLIRVDDIDFRHDLVRLAGKTGERFIPYGNKTGLALERYLKLRDKHRLANSEYLWLTDRGHMKHYTLYGMIRRRGRQSGLGEIHPHTLRHTAAHRCMEAEMSPGDMQTLFGWSSAAMLLVYARSTKKVRAQNSARRLALGDSL